MKSILLRKKIFLALTIFAVVSAAVGTVAAAITSLFLQYVWLAVSLVLAAHGWYGAVFYYIGYLNAAATARAASAIADGTLSYADLAPIMNRRTPSVIKLLEKAIARGQLVGYTVGENSLLPISDTNE